LPDNIASIIRDILIAGGGATVLTIGFIKWFGQKWFEAQFNESLEEFKRKQSEILEQYKYQINATFNRISKIHEKEFEVLPKAWHLVQDAYGYFTSVASPFQQWPNLNQLTDDELSSFLEKCELKEFQKKELRNQDDKLAYYKAKIYWFRLATSQKQFNEFRSYLRHNKIFMSREMFDLFRQIEKTFIEVEVALEEPDDIDHPWRVNRDSHKKLSKDVSDLLDGVESVVQERLRFNQA
jgi:hypothetical protein